MIGCLRCFMLGLFPLWRVIGFLRAFMLSVSFVVCDWLFFKGFNAEFVLFGCYDGLFCGGV